MKDDPIRNTTNKNILPFYVGKGTVRTKFFIFLKAKILLMDMPDLETFHIKRSKIFPVHYIYIFHSMFSIHSYLRKGAIDNFDTIFCVGNHHNKEIREIEKAYGLKSKRLIDYGFGRLDTLLDEKENMKINQEENLVIITPSYGKNNLLEVCGLELIEILLQSKFKILLRPHFRIFEESKELIETIHEKFDKNPDFILEEGVITSEKFHSSKCMISDWSGISLEYAFTFERPVIFIDVPKKVLNQNVNDISLKPIEISIREKIGHIIKPNNLKDILEKIDDQSKSKDIKQIRFDTVYNIQNSAKIGADTIEEILNELKNS